MKINLNTANNQLQMSESNNPTKEQQLSTKRIWLSTVLGILIPFTAYLYTQRWKPLLYFFGCGFLIGFIVGAATPDQQKALKRSWRLGQVYGVIVAPIDNGVAISRARKQRTS